MGSSSERWLPLSTDASILFSLPMVIQNMEIKWKQRKGQAEHMMSFFYLTFTAQNLILKIKTPPRLIMETQEASSWLDWQFTSEERAAAFGYPPPPLKSAPRCPESRLQKRKKKTNPGCNLAAVIIA